MFEEEAMDDGIEELRRVLNDNVAVKDEEGTVALRAAQSITLYFYPSHAREMRERVVTVAESYLRRWGRHLRRMLDPDTDHMERFGPGNGSNPRAWLLEHDDDEDCYLPELGGAEKVMTDLAALDSGFKVYLYDGGLIIQAGPRPQLGDGRRNRWPALYVKLAKYLKPIRVTKHPPFQIGGPDIEFDQERSEAWLRRFDDREV